MGDEERESPGATRSQHVVLQGPADARTMSAAMKPGLERIRGAMAATPANEDPDASSSETPVASPLCLIVVPSAEAALLASDAAAAILADSGARIVPVTYAARARRVLSASPVAVVAGSAADLLALRRESALRFDTLAMLVIVGLDDLLHHGADATLQALLADLPDATSRIVTLEHDSPETNAFLEAQLRRARRVPSAPHSDVDLAMTPRYLIVSGSGRGDALRTLLDAVDPPSLVVIAADANGSAEATRALRRVGVDTDETSVQVRTAAERDAMADAAHAALVVMWDAPATADALAATLDAGAVDAIALLTPTELPAFQRMAGGRAEPWTPPARKQQTLGQVQDARDALRATLQRSRASAGELALLEPLLDSYDSLEIAAAALRLFDATRRERAERRPVRAVPRGGDRAVDRPTDRGAERSTERSSSDRGDRAPVTNFADRAARAAAPDDVSAAAGAMVPATPRTPFRDRDDSSAGAARGRPMGRQRVFLAVGKRDGARVGDIVGAIANEAGIPGDRIGTVDLFESHTTVELSSEDAAHAVEVLGDVSLRGRQLSARIDERGGRPPARGRFESRDRGDGPPRGRGGAGGRSFERGARSFDPSGGDRGDRGDRGPRGDRPDRGDRSDRGPRTFGPPRDRPRGGPGERGERGDRSERPTRGDRPFERGPRPFDRGDRPAVRGGGSFGRNERPDRSERPDRGDRGDRTDRPARFERSDRGARPDRGDRGDRGDRRPPSGGRFDAGDRSSGTASARRSYGDRSPQERTEGRGEWAERGARMNRARRPAPGSTSDRPDQE